VEVIHELSVTGPDAHLSAGKLAVHFGIERRPESRFLAPCLAFRGAYLFESEVVVTAAFIRESVGADVKKVRLDINAVRVLYDMRIGCEPVALREIRDCAVESQASLFAR